MRPGLGEAERLMRLGCQFGYQEWCTRPIPTLKKPETPNSPFGASREG